MHSNSSNLYKLRLREPLWISLSLVILVSLHLKVFSFFGFDVSLAFLLIPIWVFFTFFKSLDRYRVQNLFLFLLCVLLPFLSFRITNWPEFFKTYFQYIISFGLLFVFTMGRDSEISKKSVLKVLNVFQFLLAITVTLQAVDFFILKTNFIFNFWGEHQLYYQLAPSHRMKGFYLEPSYLGFVCLNIAWLNWYLKGRVEVLDFILTFWILLLAQSSFAFTAILILFFHWFYKRSLKGSSFVYLILVLIVFVVFFNQVLALTRLSEIFRGHEHSSGYIRMVLPLKIIENIWSEGNYLGLPFGQVEHLIEEFVTVEFGESAISNSMYLIIIHFGVVGCAVILSSILIFFIVKDFFLQSFILLLFLNFCNSGSFMTTMFVFVALILPVFSFNIVKREKLT